MRKFASFIQTYVHLVEKKEIISIIIFLQKKVSWLEQTSSFHKTHQNP